MSFSFQKRIGYHEARKNIVVYPKVRRHSVVAVVTKVTDWKIEEL